MKQQTTLGTSGSFGKALIKLQLIERVKLIDGDSVFHSQIRIGVSDPAMYDQLISDVRDQMIDNYALVEKMVGEEVCFLIGKYFKS